MFAWLPSECYTNFLIYSAPFNGHRSTVCAGCIYSAVVNFNAPLNTQFVRLIPFYLCLPTVGPYWLRFRAQTSQSALGTKKSVAKILRSCAQNIFVQCADDQFFCAPSAFDRAAQLPPCQENSFEQGFDEHYPPIARTWVTRRGTLSSWSQILGLVLLCQHLGRFKLWALSCHTDAAEAHAARARTLRHKQDDEQFQKMA